MEEGKRTWEEWNSLWTFQLWLPDDRSEEHFIDRGDQLQDIKEKVQMHLLIHSYARKIGQSRLADLLAKGEKLVLFISCLALRTRPNCTGEEAVAKNPFLHSSRKGTISSIFFAFTPKEGRKRKLWNALKLCLYPKNYAQFLQKVAGKIWLKCSANTCCRTFMSSWTKDQKKYRESMQRVEAIYLLNAAKFEENPLSKVYFNNSYARLLSD